MPRYQFTARSTDGRTHHGSREAASESELLSRLRAENLFVVQVNAVAAGLGTADEPRRGLLGGLPPRTLDVETSLQQLAFMLRSGVPLLAAIRTTSAQATRASMARVWARVSDRLRGGMDLSGAMQAEACFSKVTTAMVAVGEQTGVLEDVLMRAASDLERRRTLRTTLLTALSYPAVVVVMAIGVVAYLLIELVPKLRTFLAGFNRTLPPITEKLVSISTWVQDNLMGLAIGLALLVGGIALLRAWLPSRLAMDRLILRVPQIGTMLHLAATANFARTLANLTESGVRLTDALRTVAPLPKNRWISTRILQAREDVLRGSSLAEALAKGRAFPPMLTGMVTIGETSGDLERTLDEVATYHEARLETLVRRVSALFEPVVILLVGGIVGFVYLAFFEAIYAIVGSR